MKRSIVTILAFVMYFITACENEFEIPEFNQLSEPRTITQNRNEFYKNLIDNTIITNLKRELSSETEKDWQGAFWGMGLANYTSEFTTLAIITGFEYFDSASVSFQRSLIETVYQLYPRSFISEVETVAENSNSPKIFAMCINYLIRNNSPNSNQTYLELMKSNFPKWHDEPILIMLNNKLTGRLNEELNARPSLTDILMHPIEKGKGVIYSFQRKNRDYTGITVIKKANGSFYRDETGQLFSVPQMARSVSALPGYITNGNTPEGIFSIQGIAVSKNDFIGSTPNLQLVMPYETSPQKFFHNDDISDKWNYEMYEMLLPNSWKEYLPIYESYYAGNAGRTEIISHGTTVNPEYYIGQPYYPNTPSLGCITALELWDGETGKCNFSNQLKFINAVTDAGISEGYFVLIVLDDNEMPVVIEEIMPDILRAESLMQK